MADDDDDFELPTGSTVGTKVQVDLADMDVESWKRDLTHDAAVIGALMAGVELVTPEHDLKLQALMVHVRDKLVAPINPGDRKVLIFSAFTDTADYLYRELASHHTEAGVDTAVVTGQGNPRTTLGRGFGYQQVLMLFSPRSESRSLVMPDEEREIEDRRGVSLGEGVIAISTLLIQKTGTVGLRIEPGPSRSSASCAGSSQRPSETCRKGQDGRVTRPPRR